MIRATSKDLALLILIEFQKKNSFENVDNRNIRAYL